MGWKEGARLQGEVCATVKIAATDGLNIYTMKLFFFLLVRGLMFVDVGTSFFVFFGVGGGTAKKCTICLQLYIWSMGGKTAR